MPATRTDTHRPSFLDPAEYVFAGQADFHHEEGFVEMEDGMDDRDWFVGNMASRGRCDHCGAGPLRYAVFFLHTPSNQIVTVGCKCAGILNLGSKTEREIRERGIEVARQAKRAAWEAENFLYAAAAQYLREMQEANYQYGQAMGAWNEAWDAADAREPGAKAPYPAPKPPAGYDAFISDLGFKLNRYGFLTEKQVAAVLVSRERSVAYAAKRQAEQDALATVAPLTEGRREITGEVVSTKFVDDDFGGNLKMLVREADGNKVWGTVPRSLDGDIKGATVTFTATVERSRDDEHFGFFKRPTKAQVAA